MRSSHHDHRARPADLPRRPGGVVTGTGSAQAEKATTPSFSTDLDAYRTALRSYLYAERHLDRWRGRHYSSIEERTADHAVLLEVLHRGRWNRYGWPTEAGGLGGDPRHRAVLYDELSASGLPVPEQMNLLETLGPPLVRFAPELAARYLPLFLAGAEHWGQCFSEPEAGSDLASLSTRARRVDGHYVVSGQKLWTSHGATADRVVALVRTGTPESRHRGLSMIMIDLDSPGITRRPIAIASGADELAEIFFDDVVVPADRLVGAEGQGWSVAMYLLQYERAMYAWASASVALRRLRELRDQLRERAAVGRPAPADGAARLGAVYADIITLRAQSADTVRRLAAGETVGPEASVDKILLATVESGINDAARDLLGGEFVLGTAPELRGWRDDWWYSRSATILGGSSEVQRTIIADHVLGLPKEAK
jgi:alkylation response protein AidB-like acyl-CoA dehydrogenase